MKVSVKKLLCILSAAVMFFGAAHCVYADEAPAPTQSEAAASSDKPEIVEGEVIEDGTLVYTKSRTRGCVYVTSGNLNIVSVNIPAEISGYKVLGIYDGAFAGASALTSVSISEGIEYIGSGAFYQCQKLEEVSIPESVSEIPNYCFYSCMELKKIDIPDSVNSTGAYSFAYSGLITVNISEKLENIAPLSFIGCKDLREFNVSDSNPNYKAVDGVLYSKDMTALEYFPIGKEDASFEVPEYVSYIQPGAFHYSVLQQVTMTDNVQWIGATAFSASKSLEKVVLSNNITEIGEGLFSDCEALKSIDIPDSVTSIGEFAFHGCNSLKSAVVPESVQTVGERAFGFTDDMGGKEHKIKGFKIKANYNSAAGKYARENKVSVDYLDGNPYLPFIITGIIVGIIAIAVIILVIAKKKSSDNNKKDDYNELGDNELDVSDENEDDDNEDEDDGNDDDINAGNDENYTGNDFET